MESIHVAPQGFKTVAGRVAEVIEGLGFMDGDEFVVSAFLDFAGKLV